MVDLEPCPFALTFNFEHTPYVPSFRESGSFPSIFCRCGARGPRGATMDEAIAAWNRRSKSKKRVEGR